MNGMVDLFFDFSRQGRDGDTGDFGFDYRNATVKLGRISSGFGGIYGESLADWLT